MQDLVGRTTSRRSAPPATRSRQSGLPVIVVGAGLPHLPAVLSASKSYSERLFRYQRIDRLDRAAADLALERPGEGGGRRVHARGARGPVCRDRRVPVLRPGLRQGRVGRRAAEPHHRRGRQGRRTGGRGRARGGLLRLALRAGDPCRAGVPARHGRRRARSSPSPARRVDETESVPTASVASRARPQAAVAVSGEGRAAQEGPDLLRVSAAGSRSPCRTSAGTCGPTAERALAKGPVATVGA